MKTASLQSAPNRLRVVSLLLIGLVLSACATVVPTPVPVEDKGASRPATPAPEIGAPAEAPQVLEPAPAMVPLPPPESSPGAQPATQARPAAVLALLERQESAARVGDNSRAAAELERAIRISPDDPELWLRLSHVRLAERRFDQAETLAQKCLALSGGDRGLRRRAWESIAAARTGRGDASGAEEARQNAAFSPPPSR